MAKVPEHGQADRLAIASVAGALQNVAGKLGRDEMTLDEAVAELHAITADGHLLAHGLGDPDRLEPGDRLLRIAAAAGIELELAKRLHLEMHPPGARGMNLGRRDELG